jgi:hypothetical protein
MKKIMIVIGVFGAWLSGDIRAQFCLMAPACHHLKTV